jgi:hypothetical protein
MGKTFKDIRKFDVKRHKEASREATMGQDLRTRVKPKQHKEKGGGQNFRKYLENVEE